MLLVPAMIEAPAYEDTYIKAEYVETCVQIGEEYGICPELLMAIIERESSGKADAENGSCKGLCQISEKWHAERMEELGITDIFDPESNIRLCADYLMELGAKYGDVAIVLGVYHGEGEAQIRISNYTEWILERSEELERAHGK